MAQGSLQAPGNGAKSNGHTPGIIPYLPEEVDLFEAEVQAFRAGERDEVAFQAFRLKQGVYGQRQPDRQMFRVKVPGGILTADMLQALGELAERYAPLRKGHVTTRENFQFHHLSLESAAEAMRLLGPVGLTTREAGGNTVRNISACPMVGVLPGEPFDLTPYLAAYARFCVRNPLTQAMPRKFKTAFSPGVCDCVAARMHDLSFTARVQEVNGVLRKGFRVAVGGATSIMPRLAYTLTEFVPVEDFLRVAQAVLTVFSNADMLRKNKMMARIKVLIDKLGWDTVKGMIQEELAKIPPIDPTPYMEGLEWLEVLETVPVGGGSSNGHHRSQEFELWKATNVWKQRQRGYNVVFVKLPLGDVQYHQFCSLANLARNYASGQARITDEQNLAFRWVQDERLYDVWQALQEMGLGEAEAHSITDVVACPGTDSCKLGITSSMGLGSALRESLASMNGALEDPLINSLHIKISGCPNGCSRHHVANIGFHGAAMKGGSGNQVPAYELFLGGAYEDFESTRYGERLPRVKVPAKRIPGAVKSILSFYQENRQEGEPFNQFVDRVGVKAFEGVLSPFREVAPLNRDTLDLYMDWGKSVLYKLERGEGECAV
ncbi:MAG: nitrite/sulfite reductase [Dehalococcoidia bacterium]